MTETLFVSNSTWRSSKSGTKGRNSSLCSQENKVLDPKKSQNIAIMLRGLNATKEEVCKALLDGQAESLGTELLDMLLKMAPSREEEIKLKEYKEDVVSKLGPAESFLKAVLAIPFDFKRVEAMLYITNFDLEVDYLKAFYKTLENSLGHAEINFLKHTSVELAGVWVPLQGKLAQTCQSRLHLRVFLENTKGPKTSIREYLSKMEKEVGKKATFDTLCP